MARDGAPWTALAITTVFIPAAFLSFWLLKRRMAERLWLAYLLSGLWLLAPLMALAMMPHALSAASAVRDGRAKVVEGVITDFESSTGPRGRRYECITVDGVHFHDVPSPLHGKLENGAMVRVHSIGDEPEIVRLERMR